MVVSSGDYSQIIGTGLKFLGASLEVAGAAFPGIGVLGFVLQGLADAAAAAKYNKELAHALQMKANRVSDAIKGLAVDLLQVCVHVCVDRTHTHTPSLSHTTHCYRRRKTKNEKRLVGEC